VTINHRFHPPDQQPTTGERIYLMSNGLPGQPHPDGGDRLLIVCADGFDTAMSKHDVADEIGGDDFCEPLPLLSPQADGHTLHAQLTDGVAAGLDLFVINLDTTSMQIFLADSQEATR
jgi:hypothetical protein